LEEEWATEVAKQKTLQSYRNIPPALSHNSICHETVRASDAVLGAKATTLSKTPVVISLIPNLT